MSLFSLCLGVSKRFYFFVSHHRLQDGSKRAVVLGLESVAFEIDENHLTRERLPALGEEVRITRRLLFPLFVAGIGAVDDFLLES